MNAFSKNTRTALAIFGLSAFALSACSDDDNKSIEAPNLDCNPVSQGVDCFFPFPSDWARVQVDGKTVVDFPDAALPVVDRKPLRFTTHQLDGFTLHPPIMAAFAEPISDEGLIFHTDDVLTTTAKESKTLVINAETGEAIPHFAELDANQPADQRRILQIRLLDALEPNTRYVVAVQGLTTYAGEAVQRTESFDRIVRRNTHSSHNAIANQWHQNVAPVLSDFGLNLDDVQVAWDFTTRSDNSARADILAMLEATHLWLADRDVSSIYTVEETIIDANLNIASETTVTFEVPLFLASDQPGAQLQRGTDGTVQMNGTAFATGIILNPHSTIDADSKGTIQFGHGFFGNVDEARTGFAASFGNDNQFHVAATPWWGFSNDDLGSVITSIATNPSQVFNITDRALQAYINQLIFSKVLKDIGSGEPLHFYGASLGHILGTGAVAINPEFERVAFTVGGGSFAFIMSRSTAFAPLMALIAPKLKAIGDDQKFFALSSLQLERVDPMTWAGEMLETTIQETTIQRQVLAHAGIGDPLVPTLSFMMWLRAAGVPVADSSAYLLPTNDTVALPANGSAAVVFDFNTGENPLPGHESRVINSSNTVHGEPRASAVGQLQVAKFLNEGIIENFCDGVCDPD